MSIAFWTYAVRALSLTTLIGFISISPAKSASFTDIFSPLDYSLAPYFPLKALMPYYNPNIVDDEKHFGILQIAYDPRSIAVTDQILMEHPGPTVCAISYASLCYDISEHYKPKYPQIVINAMISLTPDLYIPFGLNTGFSSPKLIVSPAFMLGFAQRIYSNDAGRSQIVVEYGHWFNSKVKHVPCADDNDSLVFCATTLFWVDFTYDPKPKNEYFLLTFTSLF